MLTTDVENFPGYRDPVTGPELIEDLSHQARRFGAEIWQTDVVSVDFRKRPFVLKLHNGTVTADSVIISTGANAMWLGAEREEEFMGRGISTCATCDGYLFRDQTVVVIGGGDSAMEEANFLARFAKRVIVVHRSHTFKASKIMLERTRRNRKVSFLMDAEVVRWTGEKGVLSGLVYRDTVTGQTAQVQCSIDRKLMHTRGSHLRCLTMTARVQWSLHCNRPQAEYCLPRRPGRPLSHMH